MPVVPRASIDDDVTVPDSDTRVGSYPAGPNAIALVLRPVVADLELVDDARAEERLVS